ncbi:MAG: hypothetical protein ACM3ZF_05790 [Mycobacterium leprae]
MKSIASLPEETLRVLDDDAMTEVVGGGDRDRWRRKHHDRYRRYYHDRRYRRHRRHDWWRH